MWFGKLTNPAEFRPFLEQQIKSLSAEAKTTLPSAHDDLLTATQAARTDASCRKKLWLD